MKYIGEVYGRFGKKYIPLCHSKDVDKMEKHIEELEKIMHYPQCWDTACYDTLESTLKEVFTCECEREETGE